ncbi:type I-E CRISPR-associated protein Cse2/CasB [Achromobacter xylosoxidans]|uniref:type I-E CRISPR-associated protein Cse2/CasB n=1 Tax=Alcaligenes xylosoxydans xylosoxydans TaxID=85698 RepID=UPI00076B7EE7|nr:type I-E CRISPR-associated protein Cse2/CasB [Achromobacter xylosoxidans]AMH04662.1 type I-E CRISPR-associated protein Cse2/CasB [Achromobacter xylosoxidans]
MATQDFVTHLEGLVRKKDNAALAKLRHSLAFPPGSYPPAFAQVERFVPADAHEQDGYRLALYVAAGLFARHPQVASRSFASAFADLQRRRESDSIEQRFIALLGADADNIAHYLRQATTLLAADGIGFDYVQLIEDLGRWMNPYIDPVWRDRIRQHWARDFYRAAQGEYKSPKENQHING